MEATYGKFLIRGSKAGSTIDLTYVFQLQIADDINHLMDYTASFFASRTTKARHGIDLVLRKAPHPSTGQDMLHPLSMSLWRNEDGWLGSSKIIYKTENDVVVLHNNQTNSTSF